MATHAIHGRAGELPTHMALSAGHGHVSTCQRERRLVVIELGAHPLCGRMAHRARRREPGRRVIRIRGLLEIGQMAAHAIHRSPRKAIVRVTLAAWRGHMSAGERELGRGIVVELRAFPLRRGMASNASSGEEGRHVIRIRGLLEID